MMHGSFGACVPMYAAMFTSAWTSTTMRSAVGGVVGRSWYQPLGAPPTIALTPSVLIGCPCVTRGLIGSPAVRKRRQRAVADRVHRLLLRRRRVREVADVSSSWPVPMNT